MRKTKKIPTNNFSHPFRCKCKVIRRTFTELKHKNHLLQKNMMKKYSTASYPWGPPNPLPLPTPHPHPSDGNKQINL